MWISTEYFWNTDDWDLYAINIANSELSLPPYTDTKRIKEGKTDFYIPSKIIL